MKELFFLIRIIEIIIQINSVVKLKRSKDYKYWNIFIGVTIASFISSVLAYIVFANNALGLGDAIACLLVCGFSFISNVIILIFGLITKKIIKVESVKLNKNSLLVGILVILINTVILFVLPIIKYNIFLKIGEKHVVNYLNNKYGNSNYKVVNVYEEYSNYGMWDKYLTGYYYEMSSDYMEDTFIISIDDRFNYIYADYFLPVYYSQKNGLKYDLRYSKWYTAVVSDFLEFDNYVKKIISEQYSMETEKIDVTKICRDYVESWSNLDGVKYNSNYYIVSPNSGKIPTIQELIDSLVNYSVEDITHPVEDM